MPPREPVTLDAPATIGNFGPGFDISSLALAGIGDRITLQVAEEDAISVSGPGAHEIPEAWGENVVGPTLDRLREQAGIADALHVELVKPRRPGSGLGSSASSAAGVSTSLMMCIDVGFWAATAVLHAARPGEPANPPHVGRYV